MYTVYLICAEIDDKKLYKIGYTKRDPEQRIKEFKTGNASQFYIIETFQSGWGTKIEAQIHKYFKSKKISGEWFDLDDEDLKKFTTQCQLIHDNLELISTKNTYYLDRGDF